MPDRPLRVALTIHSLDGGGAERLMSRLASHWAAQGHHVYLITWSSGLQDRYMLHPHVERIGLDLQTASARLCAGLRANLHRVRRLRRTLFDLQPDLVLSFCDQMNVVTLEAMRGSSIPTWIAEHSDPQQQRLSRLWEAWRRRTYPGCTGCVALTEGIAEYMRKWIPERRLRVIPPAIDFPAEAAEEASNVSVHTKVVGSERGKGRGASEGLNILFVGRLSPTKNVASLLEAWHLHASQAPRDRLWIVGDGEERERLEHSARNLTGVTFTGWLSDPTACYGQADIFVLPSHYEGFPLVLLEAMSHGLACITTPCTSAIQELLLCGERLDATPPLYVCADGSADQLSSAIRAIASDAASRHSLADHGRRVAAEYHWKRIALQWDALLDEAVDMA